MSKKSKVYINSLLEKSDIRNNKFADTISGIKAVKLNGFEKTISQ